MAFIIKAGTMHRGASSTRHANFNFEDISRQASQYLDSVKQQAAGLLAQARREAESIRARAEEAGQQQAIEAARQVTSREVAEKWTTLKPTLEELIGAIEQARETWIRDWEKQVAHLSTAIAEKIIHRELQADPGISRQWVHEALELATGSRRLKVYLSPSEYDALGEQRQAIADVIGSTAKTEFVADPTIQSGGCRVVTEHGEIDCRLESQLARIEEELVG